MSPILSGAPSTGEAVSTSETGRPWWKMCCSGCLILFIAGIAGIFITLRVFSGPGAQTVSALPPSFPADISLYKMEDASSIQYLPAESKSKVLAVISYPLAWFSRSTSTEDVSSRVQKYATSMAGSDRVTVTWDRLNATPADVLRYYAELFKNTGMSNMATSTAPGVIQAVAQRADAQMQIDLTDDPQTGALDHLTIITDYTVKK